MTVARVALATDAGCKGEGWLGANAQQVLRRFQRDSTFTRIVLTVQP